MKWLIVPGVCLGLMSTLGACAGDQDAVDDPTAGRTGPLPEGGAASCVEQYSPAAVANRAFAFDGVVVEIGPAISDRGDGSDMGLAGVTFKVGEWFSGGSGSTVTVDMPPPVEGVARAFRGWTLVRDWFPPARKW